MDNQGRVIEKAVLEERSRKGVAMCTFKETLYLAFTDHNRRIVIMRSVDGKAWGGKIKFAEISSYPPCLTVHHCRGTLYLVLGWTDKMNRMNFMFSSDGYSFGTKVTIPFETSFKSPACTSLHDKLYVAWAGTDHFHHLNIMQSDDMGRTWKNKRITDHRSLTAPDLHKFENKMVVMSWVNFAVDVQIRSEGQTMYPQQTWGEKTEQQRGSTPLQQMLLHKVCVATSDTEFKQATVFAEASSDKAPQLVEHIDGRSLAVLWKGLGFNQNIHFMSIPL